MILLISALYLIKSIDLVLFCVYFCLFEKHEECNYRVVTVTICAFTTDILVSVKQLVGMYIWGWSINFVRENMNLA